MLFVITGGAGFVGSNIVQKLLLEGHQVRVVDNLSRPGGKVVENLNYLRNNFAGKVKSGDFEFVKKSVTDFADIKKYLKGADVIYHFAAQTAVTTSLTNPIDDFSTNAIGSFNVIEAARQVADNSIILYTSTNKVYGNMPQMKLKEDATRYDFDDSRYKNGIAEDFPVDPESPYGCSKYVADAYFLDYHRTYGAKTVVFRCSCMYGDMQKSLEDQGWVSWFVNRIINGKKLTIYGNGKQIRDILHIKDVTDAVEKATEKINLTKGQVFNIGGGKENSISLLELMSFVQKETGRKPLYEFADWRLADQKVYISNTEKALKVFDWQPKVSKEEGIRRQIKWESSG